MRGYLQQVGGKLVGRRGRQAALTSLVATALYLLTMDRSASWWDCGEFIATGYLLQVGHPPGAPFYQLLQHCFTFLSFGNPMLVAPLSNALSAVAAGVTVGILYLTMRELNIGWRGALVGSACYMLCDTVWFSAVESEVYALAMLFCAADVWLMLRWRRTSDARLLPLVALLLGLGVCVHLMTLLVLPALMLIFFKVKPHPGPLLKERGAFRFSLFIFLFFLIGLTPYLIIPLRAAADPPINEMRGSFESYIKREQYAKAPLYPRMWRDRDREHWSEWTFSDHGVAANAAYYLTYQLGYMYGRYLMYNFIGRENEKWGCIVISLLPALLALWGLFRHRRRDRWGFWFVMALFLMGGIVLNFYLNHPCYEPRSRDYVYVLSFYAVAIWIGVGTEELTTSHPSPFTFLVFLAPLTLLVGNWSDHDRSHCHSVHDIALNHLQSCDHGAVLITLGDNDTFPLWYLQQVEHRRTDVDIYNIGLTGFGNTMVVINQNLGQRPVYLSQYFVDRYEALFQGRLRCEGFCWRLLPSQEGVDDIEPLQRHLRDSIEWHITQNEYLPRVSRNFIRDWERNTSYPVPIR